MGIHIVRMLRGSHEFPSSSTVELRLRTLVLLVEGTVATPPAEGVGLRVPLTVC